MTVLTRFGITLFLFIASLQAYGADHHAPTKEFKSIPISDSVFLLRGKGGNIALIKGDQGLVMVDADYKEMSAALEVVLEGHGGVKNVTYLINTHWHGDHTQGNELVGHHAQIVAHDNVRARLLTRQEIKLFGMVSEPYPEHALPSLTYSKKLSLFINGETFDIVHFPNGHTDGDSVVFMNESNIVHMGDNFFSGMFPFVDVANGGDVMQMADNVDAVLARIDDDTIVIPGHGTLSDKSGLAEFHEMLIGTTDEVKAMMAAGMTVEQMQSEGLSLDWEDWANGLISADVWIAIIASSLKAS
jgi:cyclase